MVGEGLPVASQSSVRESPCEASMEGGRDAEGGTVCGCVGGGGGGGGVLSQSTGCGNYRGSHLVRPVQQCLSCSPQH